jgi:hypothetical protein
MKEGSLEYCNEERRGNTKLPGKQKNAKINAMLPFNMKIQYTPIATSCTQTRDKFIETKN